MFRFTIRDILWVTAFAGILLTWWADHSRLSKEQKRWRGAFDALANAISNDGYKVTIVTLESYMASVSNADPGNAAFVRDSIYISSPGRQSIIAIPDGK